MANIEMIIYIIHLLTLRFDIFMFNPFYGIRVLSSIKPQLLQLILLYYMITFRMEDVYVIQK